MGYAPETGKMVAVVRANLAGAMISYGRDRGGATAVLMVSLGLRPLVTAWDMLVVVERRLWFRWWYLM